MKENEVTIEVEHWLRDGRTYARVAAVHHSSRLTDLVPMPPDRAKAFAERMRAFMVVEYDVPLAESILSDVARPKSLSDLRRQLCSVTNATREVAIGRAVAHIAADDFTLRLSDRELEEVLGENAHGIELGVAGQRFRSLVWGAIAFAYVRVSSREQAEGYSIDAQVKKLHEFCPNRGHELVRLFREVETAKKAGRPVFDEMIQLLRRDPRIDGIVCHKVDRLCRNFKDFVTVDEIGKRLLFVEEEFAPTAAGKLTFAMKVLLAKHYIDNLSDEVKKGQLEKVEQGGFPGHAPWGYVNVQGAQSVVPDPVKAPIVRWLFDSYSSGNETLAGLREKFREAGYVYRPSQPLPATSGLEYILKNRFYTGWFEFRGKTYRGKWEPIITEGLFERVQEAFGHRNRKSGRRGVQITYRGLFVCGSCGCGITGELKKGKYTYYRCTRMRGPCAEPPIREEALEEQIGAHLRCLEHEDALIISARDGYEQTHRETRERNATDRTGLEERAGKLRGYIDAAYEDKLEGRIPAAMWEAKSRAWNDELGAIERRLAASPSEDGDPQHAIRALELSKELPRLWVTKEQQMRRSVVEIAYSNSLLRDRTLVPHWRSPFDMISKGPELEGWSGRFATCSGYDQSIVACTFAPGKVAGSPRRQGDKAVRGASPVGGFGRPQLVDHSVTPAGE